jgi:predicted transcriptional regulator
MTTTARKTAAKPPSLGTLVDKLWAIREKRRELDAQVKELEGQASDLESEIMETMAEQGLDKMSGAMASVSITTNTVANVESWDDFLAFVYKKKYGHLLQRRVSDPAYRELLEQGVKVPGVNPFNKQRLNLRSR